jgi:hypothetical protein
MDDAGVHAIAGSLSPADDSAENFLIARLRDVRHVLHEKGPRHHLFNHGEKGFPELASTFIQLPVLVDDVCVVLTPADVPRKRLAGRASCNQGNVTTGVQGTADLLENIRLAQIALVRTATEMMAVCGDGIRPDIAGQDDLESGTVEPEA